MNVQSRKVQVPKVRAPKLPSTKARWIRQVMPAVVSLLIPGGLGAFVVARTLVSYWGRDWAASAIVLSIGLGLGLGLLEVLVRQLRADRLEREVRALPGRPHDATLDVAGAHLSGLLRARLEHAPAPSSSEGAAPFLTGLLVMLGLLGTLLGLFQTVQGAGQALTNSSDVDALRRSLSAPIAGLTRSFGCSAAGISASAMLGIALALTRRREARAAHAVAAYAAGPLRSQSSSTRQTRALEQLVAQGSALPAAAASLEHAGGALGELSTRLLEQQDKAWKAQERAQSELLARVRGEFAQAATDTGAALKAQVEPLFAQLVARSGEALAAQSSALTEAARDLARDFERDAALRRSEAAAALEAMQRQQAEAEQARAAALRRELEALTGSLARSAEDSERRELALAERFRELGARADAQLAAAQDSERERLRSLDAQLGAAQARAEAQLAAAHESERERLRSLDAQLDAVQARAEARLAAAQESERERLRSLDAQLGAAQARADEQLAGLSELRERIGSELERLSRTLSDDLAQRSASEREHEARSERAFAQLEAASGAIEQGIGNQERALERLVERLPPLFEQAVDSSRAAAEQALDRLFESTGGLHRQLSDWLAEEHDRRATAALEAQAQAQLALERVGQSAGLLDSALERQGQSLEALIQKLTALLPELIGAAQSGAAATLAELRELGEQQAAGLAEFEAGLGRERQQQARAITDQLTLQATDFEQRLADTSSSVQKAAAIWLSSSAEMHAVADLFATSAERQREASEAWLENLGEVEAAVERAGREAARDSLADQLASTQELFARQLQFQRELFEQLRALRTGASAVRGSNGEHDVSVGK